MLDGAARIGPMVQEAVRLGMPAIAVTDHGNTFAAFEFYKTAKDAGIKPIIGIEAYVTPGTHRSDKARVRWGTPEQSDDDVSGSGAYTHMTLLSARRPRACTTSSGCRRGRAWRATTSSRAWTASCCRRTRKGLIATTGCPSGEVQTRLRLGQYDAARAAAAEFQDIFGKENYFAEIMDHGLSIERRVMTDLLKIAKDLEHPARRDERPPLHAPARREQPRGAAVRAVRLDARRPEALQVRRRRLLRQVARRDAADLPRPPRRVRQHAAHRRALRGRVQHERELHAALPGARRARPRSRGSSRRSRTACTTATPPASPTRCARRPSTRPASSCRWASRATSSSSPTSSTGPSATASASARAVAPAPARWPPTR